MTQFHCFDVHAMEGMHTFFLFDAVSPALVAAGMKIFLDGFADLDVLDLNLEDAFIEYTRGPRRSLPLLTVAQASSLVHESLSS